MLKIIFNLLDTYILHLCMAHNTLTSHYLYYKILNLKCIFPNNIIFEMLMLTHDLAVSRISRHTRGMYNGRQFPRGTGEERCGCRCPDYRNQDRRLAPGHHGEWLRTCESCECQCFRILGSGSRLV